MAISDELGLNSEPTEVSEPAPEVAATQNTDEVVSPEEPVPAQVGDSPDNETVVVEAPAINMDEYGDQLVPVKIDGEIEYVPLKEAALGYQRQADYSRKTQAHAAQVTQHEREIQIGKAYLEDPEGTLRALAGFQGVQLADSQTAAAPQDEVYRTPEELALAEANQKIAELEQRFEATAAQTQLERDMTALEVELGEKVDRDALYQHMAAIGTARPDVAWAHLNKDAALSGRSASANAAAKAAVIEAKREAQVVHRPSTNAAQSNSKTSSEVPKSLREAALMAENNIDAPPLAVGLPWIKGLGSS